MLLKKLLIIFTVFTVGATACQLNDTNEANSQSGKNNSSSSGTTTSGGSSSEKTDAPRVLDAKFYQDSDGNAVPDFLEIENGYDPNRDDCDPSTKCGEGATGGDFNPTQENVLLMLDSSGSMRANAGGTSKIEAAKSALINHVSNAPNKIRFGFLVYGHKGNNQQSGKAESCAEIDILAPLGGIDKNNAESVMTQFQPTGWTPIGASLQKAREAFSGAEENSVNRIIMVSDGLETCGGDPVAEARKLHQEGFKVIVDVVGFDVSSNDAAQLRKIAEAGGGTYFDAKTQSDLTDYLKKQGEAWLKTMEASNCNIGAYNDAWICDAKLSSNAIIRIGEIRDAEKVVIGTDKYDAYKELQDRIRNINEERRQKYEVYKERAQEQLKQSKDIHNQTQENYEQKRRP